MVKARLSCGATSGCPVWAEQAARAQLPGSLLQWAPAGSQAFHESQLVLSSEAGCTPNLLARQPTWCGLRLCKPESEALQAAHWRTNS